MESPEPSQPNLRNPAWREAAGGALMTAAEVRGTSESTLEVPVPAAPWAVGDKSWEPDSPTFFYAGPALN